MIDFLLETAENFLEELLNGKSHGKPGLEDLRNFVSRRHTGLSYDGREAFQQIDFSNKNAAIIGGSGSGKTSTFVIPNCLYNNNISKIILDPSGELSSTCAPAMAMKGYSIKIIDLGNVKRSDFYNPLKRLDSSFSSCKQLASLLVKNTIGAGQGNEIFWNSSATNVLSIMIYLVKRLPEENQHLAQVLDLVNEFSTGNKKVDELAAKFIDSPQVWTEFKAIKATDARLMNNILSTSKVVMGLWQDEEISFLTSRDTLNFEAFRKSAKPIALFIVGNSLKMRYYAPVFSALISQLFIFLLNELPKAGDRNIMFLLDELSSYYLNEFETTVSVNRKYSISISCILQSPSQLSHIYGERAAEIIMSNLASQLFLHNMELKICKRLSEISGNMEITDEEGKKRKEQVLPVENIRNLSSSEAILLLPGTKPIYIPELLPYYKNPKLMRLIQSATPLNFEHGLPIHTPLIKLNDYAKT